MWYICVKGYYSFLNKKELLLYVTWMNFEHIMLKEISQSHNVNVMWVYIYKVPKAVNLIRKWQKGGGNGEGVQWI